MNILYLFRWTVVLHQTVRNNRTQNLDRTFRQDQPDGLLRPVIDALIYYVNCVTPQQFSLISAPGGVTVIVSPLGGRWAVES